MTDRQYAKGGRIFGPMPRVDHYEREQVLMPNGTFMYTYTPVFEIEESPCSTG